MGPAEPLLNLVFSSLAWLVLVGVFNLLALRRLRGPSLWRFTGLSLTACVWVAASALRTLLPGLFGIAGPHSLLRPLWILLCAGPYFVFCLYFYRRLGRLAPRQRVVRGDFLRALLVAVLVGPGLEFLLPLLTPVWSQAERLELWGPLLGTIPILVPAFMLTMNPIMNVRRVALRSLYYLSISFTGACILFAVGSWLAGALPHWYLYLAFWLMSGATFLVGYLHTSYLKVTIQYFFLPDVYRKEKDLQKFVNEVQTLDSARESQEIVQELILQNLFGVFRMERGFIVSVNRTGDLYARYLGESEQRAQEFQQYRPFMRRRLPPAFLEEIDRVFLLEAGVPLPFEASPERYDRVAGRIRDTAAALRDDGYEIFMPLIFRDEIWGLIFLGPKETPYFNGERILLDNARAGYAQALRNRAVLEEIKQATLIDPGERAPDSAPVFTPTEVQRIRLGDRTLIYGDPLMHTLVKKTRQIAAGYLPVLIQGETGTGKELVARLLHQSGPGAGAPFVAVNCAAIPAALWESEIFGYRKGAFTGANADSPGLVEQAAGGVIFFDEIGEMPLEIQPKILRLIQEKSYRPVGGKKNMEASCRPIFATHRDLAAMSKAGEFREDLYYRINVHRVYVPALRERRGDIALILDQLREQYADEPSMQAGPAGAPRELAPEALALLKNYAWPGNIRELENVFVRCLVEATGARIEAADLPAEVRNPTAAGAGPESEGAGTERGFEESMQAYARRLIGRALEDSGGNQSKAARLLGISRGKLIYRMKELRIE